MGQEMDELIVRICSCGFFLKNYMGTWQPLTFHGFSFMLSIDQLAAGQYSEQMNPRFILI